MDTSDLILIIILIILLFLSAFFASAETALTTISKIRMRTLADGGNKNACLVLHTIEHKYSKLLSTILIANNIVNISAPAIATTLAMGFGNFWVGIVTGLLTVVLIVFGELTPKNIARINAEKIALSYIKSLTFFMLILTPIIILVNGLVKATMLVLRIDTSKSNSTITEDELRTLVDVSHEDGIIESEEHEMINNVFDLGDAYVKDVMVPRVHVSFADVNSNYWELIEIFKKDKYTRLPVYEETTDNVIGIINMKDLLIFDDRDNFNMRSILREAFFTHEYKNISQLLEEMRKATISIAIVLDEYGDTAGLVTLEDILEEIVGDIRDEYDERELDIFDQINDLEYTVEGSVSLDDLNEHIGTNLSAKEYDSLGGYIIEKLGRHPEVGNEVITESGIRLVVDALDKNRVARVHVFLLTKEEELNYLKEIEEEDTKKEE
ncbi:MAG: hemolysin family protein [Lachnospiraceae bacterium]|nr:hemolysin family protein [Lachnospiraceae bacterium]